jgi:hypothetical protein
MSPKSSTNAYAKLLDSFKATHQKPITIAAVVQAWARTYYHLLVRIAFAMMQQPVCTRFNVPPISFIAFPSDHARLEYHNRLVMELAQQLECSSARVAFKQVAELHVEKFILWIRRELEDRLVELAERKTQKERDLKYCDDNVIETAAGR